MNQLCFANVVLLVAITGCDRSEASRKGEPPITTFDKNDKEMSAAMEGARRSLDGFISQLLAPKPGQTYFSIKARFEEGDKVEHIWLSEVHYDGKEFHGKVDNLPKGLKNVELDQACTIPRERVSDWMIIENGRLVGGATIRVARNRKTEAERKEFDRGVGFKID